VASGQLMVNSLRVMPFSFSVSCASSMYAFGTYKWNNQGDTAETWVPISDTSETWTPVTDTAEIWKTV
jgi:hypothetical protein